MTPAPNSTVHPAPARPQPTPTRTPHPQYRIAPAGPPTPAAADEPTDPGQDGSAAEPASRTPVHTGRCASKIASHCGVSINMDCRSRLPAPTVRECPHESTHDGTDCHSVSHPPTHTESARTSRRTTRTDACSVRLSTEMDSLSSSENAMQQRSGSISASTRPTAPNPAEHH